MGNQDKHQKNMKFLATAAASLALVAADKNAIDAQLMAQVANSSLRAFSGNIAVAVKRLDEYGCWCYFYDNVGRGKELQWTRGTVSARRSPTATSARLLTARPRARRACHGRFSTRPVREWGQTGTRIANLKTLIFALLGPARLKASSWTTCSPFSSAERQSPMKPMDTTIPSSTRPPILDAR